MTVYSPQGLLDLLLSVFRRASTESSGDEIPRPTRESDVEIPAVVEPPRIRRCSAWCGWSSMVTDAAVKRDVSFAKGLGLTRLDVIVNDHAAARRERPFDTYVRMRILALCKAAREAGLEIHLLSWLQPFKNYIMRAGSELNALVEVTGARSVCFDAEEPYTRAVDPLPYEEAARLVEEQMLDVSWGVTAIGYANATKLGPLVRHSSYAVPQCYATSNPDTPKPERVATQLVSHWKKIFPSVNKIPIHVGLAAYNQTGIAGHTVDQAMHAAFLDAERAGGLDVIWWSLSAIRNNKAVTTAVRSLAARARGEADDTPEKIS